METIALPLVLAVSVQLLCQLFKVVFYSLQDRRFRPAYGVTAGGMPSAHAAFVTALTVGVGIRSGPASDVFAVSCVFSAIVIYDAFRLRGHVEEHARRINRLQRRLDELPTAPDKRALGPVPEMVGHSLPDLAIGVVVGAAFAVLGMQLLGTL